jgi:membrane fusion protein
MRDSVNDNNPDSSSLSTAGNVEKGALQDFFRKEAYESTYRKYGSPIRLLGVSGWVLSIFLFTILVISLAFIISARYARKETISGQVSPVEGSYRITAQNSGIAEKVLVEEGQLVNAGDDIVSISSDPTLENGERLAAGLKIIQTTQQRAQEQQASARLEQVQSQISELRARQEGLQSDLSRLHDTVELLRRRRELQEQTLQAYRSLETQGMISKAMMRQQEDALLAIDQQIQQAERTSSLQRSELEQTAPQLRRLQADADYAKSESASVNAQLHEKQLNSDAQMSRKLVAPIAGVVTALQVRPGNAIGAGQTLAIIVPRSGNHPTNRLEVELWAPSKAIGFVKPGAPVRIMYDAFPYQTFGVGRGIVREVSAAPVGPNELPIPVETREQLFRIRVKLDRASLNAYGRDWSLVPGMRLSADLILEEQSLFEWLLAPLRAISNRSI